MCRFLALAAPKNWFPCWSASGSALVLSTTFTTDINNIRQRQNFWQPTSSISFWSCMVSLTIPCLPTLRESCRMMLFRGLSNVIKLSSKERALTTLIQSWDLPHIPSRPSKARLKSDFRQTRQERERGTGDKL
ncbi:hypothetical protein GALMADRAFT_451080 [Galerina marginata CBS 339.88]|uniref:Uncharacterized protein n=1 Tax=Galerina marginata (strain CBS 339.88) TaxID=685588 RepID=A0A067T0B3_GALM3|nr:hypothetical protein GALMADRAFT_451080 [Galerina marginata CBS 339.88]